MLLAATLLSATLCYSLLHYAIWCYAALRYTMLFNATVTVTVTLLGATQHYSMLLDTTLLWCTVEQHPSALRSNIPMSATLDLCWYSCLQFCEPFSKPKNISLCTFTQFGTSYSLRHKPWSKVTDGLRKCLQEQFQLQLVHGEVRSVFNLQSHHTCRWECKQHFLSSSTRWPNCFLWCR
jgi:hypothetical protein